MTVSRSLARFAVLGGLCLAASPASADRAADIRQMIDAAMGWLNTTSGGAATLRTSAPARVEPRGDRILVTLPNLRMTVKEPNEPETVVDFGTVSFTQADGPAGRWRLAGSLPQAIRILSGGQPLAMLAVGSSSFDLDIDPTDGMAFGSELNMDQIKANVLTGHVLNIGAVRMKSVLSEAPGGRWNAPANFTLSDLRVQDDKGTVLARIASIGNAMRMDSIALDRVRTLRARANALAASKDAPDPAVITELVALATKPDFFVGTMASRFTIDGVAVFDLDGSPLGELKTAWFDFGLRDLGGNTASLAWGYRHEGLKVSAPLPIDGDAIPSVVELGIALRNLPIATLVAEVIDPFLGGAPPPALNDPQAYLVATTARAQTTFEITKVEVDTTSVGATLTGKVSASAASPYGAVGQGAISLRGLEALVRTIEGVAPEPVDPAAVAVIAALGQQEKRTDGALIRHYRFELKDDGRVFLNDNDVTALVGKAQGFMGAQGAASATNEEPSSGPRVAAVPPDAAVIARVSAEQIGDLLRQRGIEPTLRRSDNGRPQIVVQRNAHMKAEELWIEFYECNAEDECDDIMLWSWFTPAKPAAMERINEWNWENRWARAIIDSDSDLRLILDVRAAGSGAGALEQTIYQYLDSLPKFIEHEWTK